MPMCPSIPASFSKRYRGLSKLSGSMLSEIFSRTLKPQGEMTESKPAR